MGVGVHLAIYGGLIAFFALSPAHQQAGVVPDQVVEVAFDTLAAPPEAPQPVVHAPVEAPPEDEEEEAPKDNAPHEMQDTESSVAGTQSAEKAPVAEQSAPAAPPAPSAPYYKIKPKYPRAALNEGIEGWIDLKIDITETGEVENVRVVGGEQRNLFQDEARRAVAKWKYQPILDGSGKAVRKTDHEVRVDFKLKDEANS
jgi:protein TonB